MSEESNICKFCGELITFAGFGWVHSKSQQGQCGSTPLAAPLDRFMPSESDSAAYRQGVTDGRLSAEIQQRKSNLYKGPLSGVAREILARAFETRLDDLRRLERACESPVEELFGLACIFDYDLFYDLESELWRDADQRVCMAAQRMVGSYRIDFLFNEKLVIEIDGHDFHDRDHEQASSDRRRDRDLLRRGYITIRFTGSDVYGAPLRCAAEVGELLTKRIITNE